MSDLTEFLLARVADDLLDAAGYGDDGTPGTWSHWARAVCEAHRLIVAAMQTANDHAWQDGASGPVIEFLAERVLRLLATPYADHTDYRPEWRL